MEYPKSEMFDRDFMMKNMMGPNCVKVLEELVSFLPPLQSGASGVKILDLGCGMAMSSIFLAREYDAAVFATDLWIDATDNHARIERFGLADRIFPIHAEAHALPYARGFFDAVFCVDAYHYFGAEEGYLEKYLAPLVKKGGLIAVAVPGFKKEEYAEEFPEELKPILLAAMEEVGVDELNFHSCEWWRGLWERSGAVDILSCREMDSHEEAWRDWLECDNPHAKQDIEMMKAEGGKYYNHVQIVARVR